MNRPQLDGLGGRQELYWLNRAKMTVVPDEKQFVKGYVYSVNGKEINYPADEVIHLKYAHPANDYYGFSPLTAARYASDTDKSSKDWNRNFLHPGAWPAGALETDANLDEESGRGLRADIKRLVQGGKDSVGRLLVLSGGLKYHPIYPVAQGDGLARCAPHESG